MTDATPAAPVAEKPAMAEARNFRLVVEYDGAGLHGWQVQPGRRTVQGELQRALAVMTRQDVVVHGSGRTDAGVHALAQTASFRVETRLSGEIFRNGLNGLLPNDIVVHDCREAVPDFHARFSAIGKTYRYTVFNRPLPRAIGRQTAWHVRASLNLEAMNRAAAILTGRHDFKSFEGTGSPRTTTVRHVTSAVWRRTDEHLLEFTITADGFLRYMVRNIVGTLVEVGLGRRNPEDVCRLLAAGDRTLAAATAPAHGLCLMEVLYP